MTPRIDVADAITTRSAFVTALESLVDDRVASRIFARDASLWGPTAEPEAAARLGWTDVREAAAQLIPEIEELRRALMGAGVDRFVLCGLGGSSLAPAVITRRDDVALTVLDSTHPAAVRRAVEHGITRTAVIVSSKSGSTIETRSHLATFEQAFRDAGIDPAARIIIVTDPGSPLETESRAAGRRVFLADPDVGGRFSALTAFGLVPSGFAGADISRLVAEADDAKGVLAADAPENPASILAAAIASGLPEAIVLGVHETSRTEWGLAAWIEQLIAESTGKGGRGVLPIALPGDAPEVAAGAALPQLVPVVLDRAADDTKPNRGIRSEGSLGAQFLMWEVATAELGRLMRIDPFNQPDVEAAKQAAREALAETAQVSSDEPTEQDQPAVEAVLAALESVVPAGGYLAIQAFVDPGAAYVDDLRDLRARLAARLGVPVALGFGPSYLHSTGQLHKGGPALGGFLQILDTSGGDLQIPGSESGFADLIAAQVRGDRAVLRERGRAVLDVITPDVGTFVENMRARL